jgi:hypothetical protein
MKYYFVFTLILFSSSNLSAFAIKDLKVINVSRNTVRDTDTTTVFRKRSITAGVNYGSDFQFFGRTGPVTYPYLSTDAIYNFKSGFFLYGSAVKVLGYKPLVDELDIGGGYFFTYLKKISGSLSYTRFIFNKDAADVIKSASRNNIDFKSSFDWKYVKSSVAFDYLFGAANDYFITINTSKYIETEWSIFDDKDYLTFNPTIGAILGTQNFVGRYASNYSLLLNNKVPLIAGTKEIEPPQYNNGRFNALNYSFKLPIAYNRPHYTFEAAWKYSIPVDVEGALKNRHELFFNLTFYYVFF